jgi:hypothetical protein
MKLTYEMRAILNYSPLSSLNWQILELIFNSSSNNSKK